MPEHIEKIGKEAIEHLGLKHAAREQALPKARQVIRYCANSIRATHRHESATAEQLIAQAASLLAEMREDLRDHLDIFFAGFVQDAQKEYAEAVCFSALTRHRSLPNASDLNIGWAAYLNGLAEAVGELRRYVLDQLRRGNFESCETYLGYMDDIYSLLITVDFPDAITSGLRRTTDATRGILEKTRGDLTTAANQVQLQRSMQALQEELRKHQQS
ncbi:translin [Thermosporothrix hazakensis]|jgi:translin|uniref:Translin n=2 Tax=Thermosporothrix TaxID=768650 RepID=A0A326TZU8_THEHA|nr:haloacid dehalogenase [Thermosporothrix hazakensis]PZW23340.1 translin [Thermosporothrix hazakensis]BBH89547.1 haloacid dehalogenase [Thermosporothrix sp. COM3]GCE47733.1 haloacid dehalogenase [Thermosporothrix hazakensis]